MKKTAIHVKGPMWGPGEIAARRLIKQLGGGFGRYYIIFYRKHVSVFRALGSGNCFGIIPVEPKTSKRKPLSKKISKITRNGRSKKVFVAHEFSCNSKIPKTSFKALFKFEQ